MSKVEKSNSYIDKKGELQECFESSSNEELESKGCKILSAKDILEQRVLASKLEDENLIRYWNGWDRNKGHFTTNDVFEFYEGMDLFLAENFGNLVANRVKEIGSQMGLIGHVRKNRYYYYNKKYLNDKLGFDFSTDDEIQIFSSQLEKSCDIRLRKINNDYKRIFLQHPVMKQIFKDEELQTEYFHTFGLISNYASLDISNTLRRKRESHIINTLPLFLFEISKSPSEDLEGIVELNSISNWDGLFRVRNPDILYNSETEHLAKDGCPYKIPKTFEESNPARYVGINLEN